MEITQLHKIKALLPLEATAAFLALQSILNGKLLDTGNYEGANDHHEIMILLIIILMISNVALLIRGGMKDRFSIVFSTIGFLVWAITLDRIRWEDSLSNWGLAPDVSVLIFPILAIVYSLAAAIFATDEPISAPISDEEPSPPIADEEPGS